MVYKGKPYWNGWFRYNNSIPVFFACFFLSEVCGVVTHLQMALFGFHCPMSWSWTRPVDFKGSAVLVRFHVPLSLQYIIAKCTKFTPSSVASSTCQPLTYYSEIVHTIDLVRLLFPKKGFFKSTHLYWKPLSWFVGTSSETIRETDGCMTIVALPKLLWSSAAGRSAHTSTFWAQRSPIVAGSLERGNEARGLSKDGAWIFEVDLDETTQHIRRLRLMSSQLRRRHIQSLYCETQKFLSTAFAGKPHGSVKRCQPCITKDSILKLAAKHEREQGAKHAKHVKRRGVNRSWLCQIVPSMTMHGFPNETPLAPRCWGYKLFSAEKIARSSFFSLEGQDLDCGRHAPNSVAIDWTNSRTKKRCKNGEPGS